LQGNKDKNELSTNHVSMLVCVNKFFNPLPFVEKPLLNELLSIHHFNSPEIIMPSVERGSWQ
jgi:hypothetical protein